MDFQSELIRIVGDGNVFLDEDMSKHTTFRVGGPVKCFVCPSDAEQITELIGLAKKTETKYYIIGNGSNLLVSDEGYDGMIIHIGKNMSYIAVDGENIVAEAGATLPAISMIAARNSLTGFEFASGIPGTVGGACVMNAGAYGGDMKKVLLGVLTIDQEGNPRVFNVDELMLDYRKSILLDSNYIVIKVVIRLAKGEPEIINSIMSEFATLRKEKQPLEYPSAGSTFKRPEGYFAGKLIEDAGLKGKGVGGACVSEKHAGFVINRGDASAKDVYDTIQMVIKTVKEHTGVVLEPEVRLIGNFK